MAKRSAAKRRSSLLRSGLMSIDLGTIFAFVRASVELSLTKQISVPR